MVDGLCSSQFPPFCSPAAETKLHCLPSTWHRHMSTTVSRHFFYHHTTKLMIPVMLAGISESRLKPGNDNYPNSLTNCKSNFVASNIDCYPSIPNYDQKFSSYIFYSDKQCSPKKFLLTLSGCNIVSEKFKYIQYGWAGVKISKAVWY